MKQFILEFARDHGFTEEEYSKLVPMVAQPVTDMINNTGIPLLINEVREGAEYYFLSIKRGT